MSKKNIEVVIITYKVDGQILKDWTIKLNVSNLELLLLIKIIDKLKKFDDPATPKMYIRLEGGILA